MRQNLNIFLIAPAGYGKTSLIINIQKRLKDLNFKFILAGTLITQEIALKSPLGKIFKFYFDRNKNMPANLVLNLIDKELSNPKRNYFLEGFPRFVDQLDWNYLRDNLKRNYFFVIDTLPLKILMDRSKIRKLCLKCGFLFEERCLKCNSKLWKFKESPKAFIVRVFREKISLDILINSLREMGYSGDHFFSIDNSGPFENTLSDLEYKIKSLALKIKAIS